MIRDTAQQLEADSTAAVESRGGLLGPVARHSKRLGATLQASRELLGTSGRKLTVPVHDIRLRILSLVVFSALAPALLVGAASYTTAKKILTEKLSEQLSARAFATEQKVNQFLRDRESDTKVFASAHVVSQNLGDWLTAEQQGSVITKTTAQKRLRQYLTQVQQRYPLYRALDIFDRQDRLVTTTRYATDSTSPGIDPESVESRLKNPLSRSGHQVLAYLHHQIVDQQYQPLGRLTTASTLEDLWHAVDNESPSQVGDLTIIDDSGTVLYQTAGGDEAPGVTLSSDGVALALAGRAGVAEYSTDSGKMVLGAYRYQPANHLGYLVEVSRDQAFAASLWLRNFALLVSFVVAGLVTAIAGLVILSLTRPIDKLIAGAKAAASGDLSQQIPVSSQDQIGYLTQVFNRMTESLSESREKLEKMSRTDELTGLPNRRELDRMFKTELGRAERSEAPLSVLMMDLDNFKRFNDQYGHLKGDSLLSEASHFLNLNLRPTDIATRYGGEEFVVLLPDTSKRHAAALAERLRREFAEACQGADESNPWVTISIGVATWPEDGRTKDDLIRAADTALYSAKRAGRNRVRTAVFPAPLVEQPSVYPDDVS